MLVRDDPVLNAVAVLQACGHTVEPDVEFELWQVDGGEWVSLSALLVV